MKAFERLAKDRPHESDHLIGDQWTNADIAAVCAVGLIDFAGVRSNWREDYPRLKGYWENLESRGNLASTRPVLVGFDKEKVV